MGINRKAVFFSIVSIFLVILFVATTELASEFSVKETEMDVTRTRVKILNSMVSDMENVYFEKLIYIAAKNSLVGLSKYYYDNDFDNIEYDLETILRRVITEGIYDPNPSTNVNLTKVGCWGVEPCIKQEYTIRGLQRNLENVYERLGVDVREFTITITDVRQEDPWEIIVEADIEYYFRDSTNIASWKGSTNKGVTISVIGLYAFDTVGNDGVITEEWIADKAPYTEPSTVRKLGAIGVRGNGLCHPNFNRNGMNCSNDS